MKNLPVIQTINNLKLIEVLDSLPPPEQFPPEIQDKRDFQFIDPDNYHDFLYHIEGIKYNLFNKLKLQVKIHVERCIDAVDDDRACQALAVAKATGMQHVKGFCAIRDRKLKTFEVEADYPFLWRVQDARTYAEEIPLEALQTLMILKDSGIEPDGLGVGVRFKRQPPKPKVRIAPIRDSDPVFIAKFGKFYMKLFEWD